MSNVPNNKVPLALPPVTTGRPVCTQATQGSPRLCGAWGKAVGGRVGRGGRVAGGRARDRARGGAWGASQLFQQCFEKVLVQACYQQCFEKVLGIHQQCLEEVLGIHQQCFEMVLVTAVPTVV